MLRATTPRPLKRKRFCGSNEGDDDEDGEEGSRKEREERERMMKIGDEGVGRGRGNAYAYFSLSANLAVHTDLIIEFIVSQDWLSFNHIGNSKTV